MNQVVIELPDIKAVSRNDTTGHYFKYRAQLQLAEQWMAVFGRKYEHHFDKPVDVEIDAYYDCRGTKKIADAPNIDDKIFTDILNRFKPRGRASGIAIERRVWFIQDDSPTYLRQVIKRSHRSDRFRVIITITEVEENTIQKAPLDV